MPQGAEPPQSVEHFLTGPVTLYEVAAVREGLRTALADGRPLRIDLSDSGPWDIAGLQLLIAGMPVNISATDIDHLAATLQHKVSRGKLYLT